MSLKQKLNTLLEMNYVPILEFQNQHSFAIEKKEESLLLKWAEYYVTTKTKVPKL